MAQYKDDTAKLSAGTMRAEKMSLESSFTTFSSKVDKSHARPLLVFSDGARIIGTH